MSQLHLKVPKSYHLDMLVRFWYLQWSGQLCWEAVLAGKPDRDNACSTLVKRACRYSECSVSEGQTVRITSPHCPHLKLSKGLVCSLIHFLSLMKLKITTVNKSQNLKYIKS